MGQIDDIFAFSAKQQTEAYNRIAAYKEKQAAHELLIAQIMHENAQLSLKHTQQALRPSIMIRPTITRDPSGEWIASHGDCQGRGPTPDLAYQAFDAVWVGKAME
jgi:hypothetical protein